jgi:hypothetical protein
MKTTLRPKRPAAKRAVPAGLRLVTARSADEVARLEGPWRSWDALGGAPSAHFAWTRACLKAFPAEAGTSIVAVVRGERLSAAAPLVRERSNGIHRLCIAGASRLGEPADVVWSDPAGLDQVVAALLDGGSPLVFERLPEDSPALVRMQRLARGRARLVVRPAASYSHLPIDESWLTPQQHLPLRQRDLLAQARREAERLGAMTIEIHTPRLHELPGLLDAALEATGHGGAATSADDALDRAVFYRHYAEAASIDGALRVCLLRIGDRVAASALGVETGGAFWQLGLVVDQTLGVRRLDGLLVGQMIRYAAEAGLASYEFWGGADAGCWDLMAVPRRCVSLRVYPFGPRGLAALVADAAVEAWRGWRDVWREMRDLNRTASGAWSWLGPRTPATA